MAAWMAFGLFAGIGVALMAGFPVAFTLAGVALLHAYLFLVEGRRADADTCLTLLNEALETAMG